MSEQRDTVLHPAHHLLPHPLRDVHVPEDNDDRPSYEPDRVETEERVVEPALEQKITTFNVINKTITINNCTVLGKYIDTVNDDIWKYTVYSLHQ